MNGQPSPADSFDYHRAHPDVTTDNYLRERSIELGKLSTQKTKIYLDLRYWIYIRDAHLNRAHQKIHYDLLEIFISLAEHGNVIFPMSDAIFLEVLKQTDPKTLSATALLIDRLSNGFVLANEDFRMHSEIVHFLHGSYPDRDLHSLNELAWTRPMSVMGSFYPDQKDVNPVELRVLQKAWIDYSWDVTFQKMILNTQGQPPLQLNFEPIAKKLNAENANYADEIKSFRQAVLAEMVGVLDLFRGVMADTLLRMYQNEISVVVKQSQSEREASEKQLFNFMANAFDLKPREVGSRLRTAYIKAKCHAAVRWDRKRLLSANDLYDFRHAAAAVGYCDAFFTERSLSVLLNANHVNLGKEFNCHIEHEANAIRSYVDLLK